MTTKTAFEISNRTAGLRLGTYLGTDAADAVEAMYRDAGYSSGEAAAEALGTTRERLYADLCVEDA